MALVTVSGLDGLISDLNAMPIKLHANAYTAIVVCANKIKASARAKVSGHKHLPQYPASIQYEITANTLGFIQATIEPKGGQGQLGTIIEFGGGHNAPIPHMGPALWENETDLLTGLGIAVSQAIA